MAGLRTHCGAQSGGVPDFIETSRLRWHNGVSTKCSLQNTEGKTKAFPKAFVDVTPSNRADLTERAPAS